MGMGLEGRVPGDEGTARRPVRRRRPGLARPRPARGGFGAAGQALGIVAGLSDEEATVARIALATGGTVHQLLTGTVTGEEVVLDGKILRDSTLKDCTVIVRTGDFVLLGSTMDGCKIQFEGAASNVASMAQQVVSQRAN